MASLGYDAYMKTTMTPPKLRLSRFWERDIFSVIESFFQDNCDW
jgi:hypothetical protein